MARPLFFRVNAALFHLGLRGLGVLNHGNPNVSGEEYLISQILPQQLRNPATPVFVDVGANIGDYTAMLRATFPTAKVIAVEPHPENFAKLGRRFDDSVLCLNVGAGQTEGLFTLYDRADQDGSQHASLHAEVISDLHKQDMKAITVQVRSLSTILKDAEVDMVDLLKIDTEGHELSVLQGAEEFLSSGRIAIIQFEFNEMNIVSRTFLRDFRKLLIDYDLYRLLPRGLLKLNEIPVTNELFAYQNIVAIIRR